MEENRLYESPQEGYSLCVWVTERLPDLQEGYLDALTAEAVHAHLAACFMCARVYNEMELTVRLVETLPFVESNEEFSTRVMAAINSMPGRFFRPPGVGGESQTLGSDALSRTITGVQRLYGSMRRVPKNKPPGDAQP